MQLRNSTLFSCVALAFLVTLNSCSAIRIGQLEGRWQVFYLDDLADENIYVWEFAEGSVFTITRFTPPTSPDGATQTVICRGEYSAKAEFLDAAIQINNIQIAEGAAFKQLSMIDRASYDVRWTILKVDGGVLRLGSDDVNQHNGGSGYVVREFTSIN